MPVPASLVPRLFLPTLRWLRAVAVLAILALAAAGTTARIGGEMNAALQSDGARTAVLAFVITPVILAFRSRRSSGQPGNV